MTSAAARILWLSNETPDRAGQGGQRRQFFQIAALREAGIAVTVVTLAGPQSHATVKAHATVHRTSPYVWRGLPSLRHRRLVGHLAGQPWDGVVVAHTESWPTWQGLLRRPGGARLLVDMHNVLSAWHEGQGRAEEAQRWAEVERQIFAHGACVTVCSEREASLLADSGTPIVLPHGVDPDEWPGARMKGPHPPVVKLFGNWAWAPNEAGLRWFLEEVWPRREERESWACQIAGTGVVGPLPPGVVAVGRVESLSDFLADATVVAVPVRNGVGAPVKFAEALASGAPVLASLAGAPNLASLAACVSDEPSHWAHTLTDVLRRPDHYESVGRHARETVLRDGSWPTVSSPLIDWALREVGP